MVIDWILCTVNGESTKGVGFSGLRESTNGATVGALLSSSLWA